MTAIVGDFQKGVIDMYAHIYVYTPTHLFNNFVERIELPGYLVLLFISLCPYT